MFLLSPENAQPIYFSTEPFSRLVDKEMKLEFREIDRCRRSDAKLFYAAMRMLAEDSKDDAGFSRSAVEGMGSIFIDSLVVKGPDFNETDFTLLKNDVVACINSIQNCLLSW